MVEDRKVFISGPKEIVDDLERGGELTGGDGERFSGYGVMGLPFTSGHILCLRR